MYRAVSEEDRAGAEVDEQEALANLLWVAVHRFGPIDEAALAKRVPADTEAAAKALASLLADGRVQRSEAEPPLYRSDEIVIPVGDSAGWEAAVFDHYQAMVTALCTKLRTGSNVSGAADSVGGSTYTYDVWPEHPHQAEVTAFLGEVRAKAVALREKVEAYNESHRPPDEDRRQTVIAYVGQTVLGNDAEGEP